MLLIQVVSPDRHINWHNPQSISFLPTSLLSNLLLNAFKSVEEMHDLTENINYCTFTEEAANETGDGNTLARNSIETKENMSNSFNLQVSFIHFH